MGKRLNAAEFIVGGKPLRDDKAPEHLAFVASLGCCITGAPCVVHHLLISPEADRGIGKKSSDRWVLPLAPSLHDALHRAGNETTWFRQYKIEPMGLSAILWSVTGNRDAAMRAIRWLVHIT